MLAIELAKYLSLAGIGVFDEVETTGDIFVAQIPSEPNDCICIFPTGGPISDMKLGYDMPTQQIIVRGTDYSVTSNRASDIYNFLHGLGSVSFPDETWVVSCQGIQSGPTHIGQDKLGRHEFSLNFRFEVRNKNINRE